MVFEFKFPDVGEGINEGEIVKWRVKEGDRVNEHDIIVDVETDKAVVQIPSPKTGTVLKINFQPGQTVKVGEVLAVIGETGEAIPTTATTPGTAKREPQKGMAVVGELEVSEKELCSHSNDPRTCPICNPGLAKQISKTTGPGVNATPAVRKLAKDLG